jgi:hypothetical protein
VGVTIAEVPGDAIPLGEYFCMVVRAETPKHQHQTSLTDILLDDEVSKFCHPPDIPVLCRFLIENPVFTRVHS